MNGDVHQNSGAAAQVEAANGAAENEEGSNASAGNPLVDKNIGVGDADDDRMRWNYRKAATGPRLTFGEPQTDNIRLSLSCSGGNATFHFMRSAQSIAGRPDTLAVQSGPMQWQGEVSVRDSELGGKSISATAPLSSAAMTAFASGQPLSLQWGDMTIRVPASESAETFVGDCS